MVRGFVSVLLFCAAGCVSVPRDPEGTLDRVRGGKLHVGLVEHPPWVMRTTGEPAGVEVELVRQLAADLGVAPEWTWGGEQRHMEALEHFELDLVVGGLTDDNPWSKRVGLTGAYAEFGGRKYVMAVPPGENGWLCRVERFLHDRREDVPALLQRETTPP